MVVWCFRVFFLLACLSARAWPALEVSINRGVFSPTPLAVSANRDTSAKAIRDLMMQDLVASGVFSQATHQKAHTETIDTTTLKGWHAGGRAHLFAHLTINTSGSRITIQCRLFDLLKQTELTSFALVGKTKTWRRLAHQTADRLYQAVTGSKGYFDTQVVYVGGMGTGVRRAFRLAFMDADGHNHRHVRHFNTLLKMPFWDVENDRVFYIRNDPKDKNRLFELDLFWNRERAVRLPSDVFSVRPLAQDRRLLIALRHKSTSTNQPDRSSIGVLDVPTKRYNTLMPEARCIYVSPTGCARRGRVILNSDHEGKPRLYEVPLSGGWIRRFSQTAASYYSPMLSPDDGRVVFIKRDQYGFHVALSLANGSSERILATFDWAENPCWAPGGSAVIFTATRNRRIPSKLYRVDLNSLKLTSIPTLYQPIEPYWAKAHT